jgi:undecaprenyl-diphosphatase
LTIADAVLLGAIQGLTEFLPVSSSGHLVLAEHFISGFDQSQGLLFNVTLHVGTLVSVLVYYRRDLADLASGLLASARRRVPGPGTRADSGLIPPDSPDLRYVLMIVLATVMFALVAFPLRGFVMALFGDSGHAAAPQLSAQVRIQLVGAALLVTGLLLWLGERWKGRRSLRQTPAWRDALLIGLAQGVAIIPGISRSGATISAALFRGIDGGQAVRFSFLLSIPAIVGAHIYTLARQAGAGGLEGEPFDLLPYLVGAAAAFAVGLLAIKIIVVSAQRGRLLTFAIYCWALGGSVILFA